MFKKVIQRMFILAVVIVGLIVLITGGFWLLTRGKGEDPGPIVSIHSPENGSNLNPGDIVGVNSTSRDENQSITSVELWVFQEGIIQLAARSLVEGGSQMISLTQGWQPLSIGEYRLIVRAFNKSGNSGQAAVEILIVEQDPEEEAALEEGEPLTEIAGDYVPIQPYPGGEDPGGSDPSPPPPPDPDPDPLPLPEFLTGFLNIVIEPFFPFDQTGTWVEVEAVSFQVQEEYDELYCYVGLGDISVQRVPETGSFHVSNTYDWNLPDYLGGNNKKVVFVPENESLDLHLDCWGLDSSNSLRWAGLYKAEHPQADWNGALIEGHSTEGDGLTITYRINPAGGPLLAPTNLRQIVLNHRILIQWDWIGIVNEIDGYKIYRDNSLVATIRPDIYMTEVPQMWIAPPCGEEYRYHIVAYQGSIHSPRSNYLEYQAENCDGLDNIDEILLTPSCDNSVQTVNPLYQYNSEHGGASMDIRAVKDGQIVQEIFSSRTQIEHGVGGAMIKLTNFGDEPIQTDQLTFYMYDLNNMPFYVETVNQTITWGAGRPDLSIPSAWVDRPNSQLKVKVRNEGCSGLAITPELSIFRQADDLHIIHQITKNIRPGSQELITIDLDPGEMDTLWSGEIDLDVDPFDAIEEISEINNYFHIAVARIKRVVFNSIDVFDDHDWGLDPGEWLTYFYACGRSNLLSNCPEIYKVYSWDNDSHTIYGVFFNPVLSSDDALIVGVRGYEDDYFDYSGTPFGEIMVYHSPDGNNIPALDNAGYYHMGSWKLGGTFEFNSDANDYRIFYEIVMEYY